MGATLNNHQIIKLELILKKLNAVLIRGLSRDSRHWLDFPKVMKKNNIFNELIFLDLPGFGTEWNESSPFNVEEITNFVRSKWLKEKKKEQGYIIIGMSLGGMVAINWASRFPEDIAGVVTINTSLPEISPKYKRVTPTGFIELMKMFSAEDFGVREELILALTSNRAESVDKYLKLFTRYQLEMTADKKDIIKQVLAARNMKIYDELIPSLLCLTSKGDRMVDCECSKDIAEKYNGVLHIHPDAGHDLTMDDPVWVVEEIEKWLRLSKIID